MGKYNFALCTVLTHFDCEMDQSMCRVDKPLQLFETKQEADEAYEIMSPFYNWDLHVVHIGNMDSTFR